MISFLFALWFVMFIASLLVVNARCGTRHRVGCDNIVLSVVSPSFNDFCAWLFFTRSHSAQLFCQQKILFGIGVLIFNTHNYTEKARDRVPWLYSLVNRSCVCVCVSIGLQRYEYIQCAALIYHIEVQYWTIFAVSRQCHTARPAVAS